MTATEKYRRDKAAQVDRKERKKMILLFSGMMEACTEAVEELAGQEGIPVDLVLGRSRLGPVTRVRFAAAHAMRTVCGLDYESIAVILDRDHSSVINMISVAETENELYVTRRETQERANRIFVGHMIALRNGRYQA